LHEQNEVDEIGYSAQSKSRRNSSSLNGTDLDSSEREEHFRLGRDLNEKERGRLKFHDPESVVVLLMAGRKSMIKFYAHPEWWSQNFSIVKGFIIKRAPSTTSPVQILQ
jgi:hypothetical protein